MTVMYERIVIIFGLTSLINLEVTAYVVPDVNFEALSPRGIRMFMQDDGFSSIKLIYNFQRESETKQLQIYLPKPKNGKWTFVDRNFELRIGDSIYFTVSVAKKNLIYQKSGSWYVSDFVIDDIEPSCEISKTETLCSKKLCKNTLIFNEEFNDPNNFEWQRENMFPKAPDYPFNGYSGDNVRVLDGNLIIEASRTLPAFASNWDFGYACTGEAETNECKQTSSGSQILPPVVSGKVTTRNLFSFKYGRIDVRAKLPAGDWLIPEINLEPLLHAYGRQHYGSGLMRVAYVKGNQEFSRQLYGGAVVYDAEPCRSIFIKKLNKLFGHWNYDFHVYSVIWKPDGIQLLVDGEVYGDLDNSETFNATCHNIPYAEMWSRGSELAPFDQMFYVSLGMRVGGINDFADTPEKPWKNSSNKAMFRFWENTGSWHNTWTKPELLVDYVRVYSL